MKPNTRPTITDTVTALFLATLILFATASAHAAWVVEPTFDLSSGYDDNVRLREQNEVDGFVTTATLQAQLRNVTERSEVAATAGVGYVAYADVDDLDNEDLQFLRVLARRNTERMEFGLRGNGRRDLVLRRLDPLEEPLDVAQPDETNILPPDDEAMDGDIDAGAVSEQVRRTRIDLAPYVQADLDERTDLRLGLAYARRFYDDEGERAGLRDTTSYGADARVRRALSPRTSVNLTVRYSLLESDAALDTDTYSATVGWQHRLTPATDLGVEVGANRTENDIASDTSMRFRVSASHTTPLNRFAGSVERSAVASPFGGIVQADRVSAEYRRLLAERLELNLSVYGFRSERLNEGDGTDRKYLAAGPELFWRASPNWRLGAAYRFRWVDRAERDGSAQSNTFSVSLRYQPQRRI
jgi:opacity protein-like surface antigen